jgi:hypothetical protein
MDIDLDEAATQLFSVRKTDKYFFSTSPPSSTWNFAAAHDAADKLFSILPQSSTRNFAPAHDEANQLFSIARTNETDEVADVQHLSVELCDTVSQVVSTVPPAVTPKKSGSLGKRSKQLKFRNVRKILGVDESESRDVNRLLRLCMDGKTSEILGAYDLQGRSMVAANAFRSFFQKQVTHNTSDVQQFRRNFASVLAAEGADVQTARCYGISPAIFDEERQRLSKSTPAPIVGAIARRTNSNAVATTPKFVTEVRDFCEQYSAVNPSKQKNVLARDKHGLLRDTEGQRFKVQIRELHCKKTDLYKLWTDAKKDSEFSHISPTLFYNAIPNWIREGRSTICTCVACDQMLGFLLFILMYYT